MGEGILFIRRNPLDLAHQVGRPRFQNGARGLGDSKKERKGCRGPCYRPGGPTPGGYFCLITPPYKVEGIQRGSSMSQRKKCGLGKRESRRALCPDNGRKGGLGEKSYRGAAYEVATGSRRRSSGTSR